MPKLIDPGPSEAGWHRLQTALQCPRKYALNLEKPRTWSAPLVKGSLVHLGIAHYYARKRALIQGTDPDEYFEPIEAIGRLAIKNYSETREQLWMEHAELCQYTTSQYISHWHAEGWEPLHIEEQFRSHVTDDEGNRFLYTQRADLIVADSRGKIWIVDHKTTYRIAPKTIKRYTLSGQFLGYRVLGEKAFGKNFGGVVLNMLQLPKEVGDEIIFKRPTLDPAPYALRTFKQTIINAEKIIRSNNHLDNAMDWPAVHHETACWTPYGACPFHETCQFGF